jgi:hypothetical protein
LKVSVSEFEVCEDGFAGDEVPEDEGGGLEPAPCAAANAHPKIPNIVIVATSRRGNDISQSPGCRSELLKQAKGLWHTHYVATTSQPVVLSSSSEWR